jgi:hydrolase, alpha/beta domain protein
MYITYKGVKLHYEKFGNQKETVIILPGWGKTKDTFKGMINSLRNSYTVYLVDYPGFGKTPFPKKVLTMHDYVGLIITLLDKEQITNPYIIAHSFGGRIAILLTGLYNIKIKKLLLIDSAGIKPRITFGKWLRLKSYKLLQWLARIVPKKYRVRYKKMIFKLFASSDYSALNALERETFKNIVNLDLTDYLENIKTETLILWGDKDTATHLSDGVLMKKKIRDSELIVFKNSTHYSYLENLDIVLRIIYIFFKD